MTRWAGFALGCVAGGIGRYALGSSMARWLGADFPYGTLAVNLSACLLIGVLNSLAEVRFLLGPDARLWLMAGFCGAYSTFSTLLLETSNLVAAGETMKALANYLGSGVLGFILFRVGMYLGTIL